MENDPVCKYVHMDSAKGYQLIFTSWAAAFGTNFLELLVQPTPAKQAWFNSFSGYWY